MASSAVLSDLPLTDPLDEPDVVLPVSLADANAAPGETGPERQERFRRNVGTVALVCLLVLGAFYTLYFAREVFMPVAMAMMLKLLLNPGVRALADLRVPLPVGAAIMVALFLVGFCAICYTLASPASEWAGRMPQWLPVLQQKMAGIAAPLGRTVEALQQMEKLVTVGGGSRPMAVDVGNSALTEFLFTGTRSVLSLFGTTILMLYFLLAAGDTFLRRLVEVLPRLRDKKHAVEATRQVERDVSTYLVTITIIYAGVGTLTGAGLALLGMPDPLLWGVLVFALAYVPYLGPLTAVITLAFAALMSFDTVGRALAVPGLYLGLVLIEGQFLTPVVLARRMTLNPVAQFISLLLWGFIWGVPGALLAVPLLATFKIACDHIRPLYPLGHFLGE